jgi:hypothetical protein
MRILSGGRAGGRTKARAKWPVFGRREEGETGAFPGRRRRSRRSRAHWTSSGRTFKNLRLANHSLVARHDYSNASDRVCAVVKNEARVKRIGQPHWPAQCDYRRSERWSRCASEVNPKRARGGPPGCTARLSDRPWPADVIWPERTVRTTNRPDENGN